VVQVLANRRWRVQQVFSLEIGATPPGFADESELTAGRAAFAVWREHSKRALLVAIERRKAGASEWSRVLVETRVGIERMASNLTGGYLRTKLKLYKKLSNPPPQVKSHCRLPRSALFFNYCGLGQQSLIIES